LANSVADALRQVDALVAELQSTIAAPCPRVSQRQAEAS
ncbi:MAG TPA: NAD(P)H dehydrogenase, partial [Pseudomonas sp.]|nr:NAD(P)H dehydrogenase [Pseudomonas sp.]